MLIKGGMRGSHVVRIRILVVIPWNSIRASEHVSAVWELVKHGIRVGLAHWYSRVALLGLSHLGSNAEIQVLEGSGKIVNSDIAIIRMHVCNRTRSKCMSGECGVHVPVHVPEISRRVSLVYSLKLYRIKSIAQPLRDVQVGTDA